MYLYFIDGITSRTTKAVGSIWKLVEISLEEQFEGDCNDGRHDFVVVVVVVMEKSGDGSPPNSSIKTMCRYVSEPESKQSEFLE
jgi:hypothetical protein